MSQERIDRFRTWMRAQNIDAFLVTQPQNRSYLSGWLSDDIEAAGMAVVGQQEQILLTSALYEEVARREAVGWEVIVPTAREYAPALATLAQEHEWEKIGFESKYMSYWEHEQFREAGKREAERIYTLQPFEQNALETMRQVKQPYEIELLKHAIAITDETFAHICQWIQPGMTEKEVQWEISRMMIVLGADAPAFESIVAAGQDGSMPHAEAGQHQIQRGELITIDMGARYKGYCADMTRTICLGEPKEPRMREVYEAVLDAMKTCEVGLHAGISGRTADALARDTLQKAGLDEYFVHSIGHGVGLQVHEGPNLSRRAPEDMMLPVGSVVTVEPGVYIPGWTGTRVEDCVLIQENGAEVLTQSPTNLVLQR